LIHGLKEPSLLKLGKGFCKRWVKKLEVLSSSKEIIGLDEEF